MLIKPIEINNEVISKAVYTSCVIINHNNRLLLQYRPPNWRTFPDYLCCFGGKVESNEMPNQTISREINEELGGKVKENELIFLVAYTEEITNHKDIVFGYFWKDSDNTITGCYEAECREFETFNEVKKQSRVMDDTLWLLNQCYERSLIKL